MLICSVVFFFKQKTAYEMRISDWSSDVCSSDLRHRFIGWDEQRQSAQHPFDTRHDRSGKWLDPDHQRAWNAAYLHTKRGKGSIGPRSTGTRRPGGCIRRDRKSDV